MAQVADETTPLHHLLSHELVDLYVGPDNTHWVLHEKLLCAKSAFFANIFQRSLSEAKPTSSPTRTFGLPDEDDAPFGLFVSWLYSNHIPLPAQENDLGDLLDLYLMGEKWYIARLVRDVLTAVRDFYRRTETFPGLRRVQYVYANTLEGSPMRHMLVACAARLLVLKESSDQGIPAHWENALKKNAGLAVDVIKEMRRWQLGAGDVPDPRHEVLPWETEDNDQDDSLQQDVQTNGVQHPMPNGIPHGA